MYRKKNKYLPPRSEDVRVYLQELVKKLNTEFTAIERSHDTVDRRVVEVRNIIGRASKEIIETTDVKSFRHITDKDGSIKFSAVVKDDKLRVDKNLGISIVFDSSTRKITIGIVENEIDHTKLQNVGTYTHAQIDNHIDDSTIHFTEASIDHKNIQNIGTKTHDEIDTHIDDKTNPHEVTAVQVGADPAGSADAVQDNLDTYSWQLPVISIRNMPPSSNTKGDRYLIGEYASGVWEGLQDLIAEWDGSDWFYIVPDPGFALVDLDTFTILGYDGIDWLSLGDDDTVGVGYTPILTAITNSSSLSVRAFHYTQISNVVTVSGQFSVTLPSANAITGVRISLPVARNIIGAADVSGVAIIARDGLLPNPIGEPANGFVYGSSTYDEAVVRFYSTSAADENHIVFLTFSYRVDE